MKKNSTTFFTRTFCTSKTFFFASANSKRRIGNIRYSLVGDILNSVMWTVIQHSNTEMMEEYLPIIQNAVNEKGLDEGALKMTIDRYYGLKYGFHVFGSKTGFGLELADDKMKKEIELKYGIE